MRLVLVVVFCLIAGSVFSQTVKVPTRMEFAGIQLKLSEGARNEIQVKVDQLTRSPKHFNVKAQRAASYFPIVEQVFEEEGLPDDFKYLAIQESGYISDVVSTSNAVGFWQFKKETAQEVGLRVDNEVDERLNIVSASRGAAKYLQQNNLFFNNWVHALQAYQMGAGGTQRSLAKIESGVTSMHITKDTYWYVITFLAHKIAFEEAVELVRISAPKLYVYTNAEGKSLEKISKTTEVSLDTLKRYNKWLKTREIPTDKSYFVIIPNFNSTPITPIVAKNNVELSTFPEAVAENIKIPHTMVAIKQITINGLPAIMSNTEMGIDEITDKLGVTPIDFASYNDILPHYQVVPNQIYYLKRKMTKANIYYHTVKEHQTLWSISQEYGVSLDRIKKMNRITKADDELEVGRVLWLKKVRPKQTPIEFKK